jgi:hypothetical protein
MSSRRVQTSSIASGRRTTKRSNKSTASSPKTNALSKAEIERERRLQQALDRLGVNDPKCVICGNDKPFCLERHHPAGRANHDDTYITCKNDHAILSNEEKDHSRTKAPLTKSQVIGKYLLGLADMLALVVERLKEFGTRLLLGDETQGDATI